MEMSRRRGGATNPFHKKQSGKLKKLGLTDEKLNEFSDLEKEVVCRKKSRIPKKKLKETSNGVDHASVPRKLRSAMKKRNLESVSKLSSVSSKRFHRSESFNKDYLINKENQEMEAKANVSESMMMISKDEKEVAETLYGLAEMFTESEKTCDHHLSGEIKTSKVVEAGPLEPAISVISSHKTKQMDEMRLEQSDKHSNSKGMVGFIDRLKQSSLVNVTDSPVRAIETKVATSDMDYKNNDTFQGLALWPGLSSTVQPGAHVLSKPSSTKLPPWMGQAVSPSENSSPLRVQPRKLKKCASHIYISRLIKVLQSTRSRSSSSSHQNEQRSSEISTISDFKSMVSPTKRYHRTYYPKPVQEDMTQLALDLYNPHTTSQKQSYDFLSLASSGTAQSQSHFPHLNSLPQYHHISAAYNSKLSPQTSSYQVQQISPYLASRFQKAYNANQQQQQQQQLQKKLWAAQYRPPISGNTVPLSNQYSKPNLALNLTSSSQCSIQPPLHFASSPRYNNNNNVSHSQQQQHHRLMAAAMSMSHHHHHNNLKSQEQHHFPLIYEDARTPLQLLCNEQS